ncbi:B3 domain-containing protein At2g36080 [Manihot esculenta]|uniref:TF-B3 domain-containing protein n=1 Tax=Manihot esculenta TaxID=3983 RepID=A0A2C9V9Q2_MANES|nr:B3 domain-containing protein At2g36080 [Manihot esculenta]OAY40818.1 hypothetical protein MANES_09G051400v8 [Manihot esculenta]
MFINLFSTDLPHTLRWTQHLRRHHQLSIMDPNTHPNSSWPSHRYSQYHHRHHLLFSPHSPSFNFSLNRDDNEEQDPEAKQPHHRQPELEKEPMFEKPLTPSDVGKLNRLVIPKQHAEKYFPLGGDSADKGLFLSFEDESGKLWRFRYSYWNSSQSYVLTKGWSRYVKEKQLDAGDVVSFERHRTDDGERLFIGWRRRGDNSSSVVVAQGNNGGLWSRGSYSSSSGYQPYQHGHRVNVIAGGVPFQHAGSGVQNSKKVRLFGVNLECQVEESEPSTPDGSSLSSQGPTQQQLYSFYSSTSSSSNSSHSQMVSYM